jgi:hypothetical protein
MLWRLKFCVSVSAGRRAARKVEVYREIGGAWKYISRGDMAKGRYSR